MKMDTKEADNKIVSTRQALFEQVKKQCETQNKEALKTVEVNKVMIAQCDKIISEEISKK